MDPYRNAYGSLTGALIGPYYGNLRRVPFTPQLPTRAATDSECWVQGYVRSLRYSGFGYSLLVM